METVRLEEIPKELRSRVAAVTGEPDHLRVQRRRAAAGSVGHDIYFVEAVTGDRVMMMRLLQRSDGSVDEFTETFTTGDVVEVHHDGEEALVVRTLQGLRCAELDRDTVNAVESVLTQHSRQPG